MPIHPEHVNIAIRQTVRDLPNNPTPIHLPGYLGKRVTKLRNLAPPFARGLAPGDPAPPAPPHLDPRFLQPVTYSISIPQALVGPTWWITLGPLTGVYKLTMVNTQLTGWPVNPIEWIVVKNDTYPNFVADVWAGEMLIPHHVGPVWNAMIYQDYQQSMWQPLAIQRFYDLDYVTFLFTQAVPGGVTDFINLALSLEEIAP